MKKNSFKIAVILTIVTYLISIIPNPNQIEIIDLLKAVIGMILGVLALIFMIMSYLYSDKM